MAGIPIVRKGGNGLKAAPIDEVGSWEKVVERGRGDRGRGDEELCCRESRARRQKGEEKGRYDAKQGHGGLGRVSSKAPRASGKLEQSARVDRGTPGLLLESWVFPGGDGGFGGLAPGLQEAEHLVPVPGFCRREVVLFRGVSGEVVEFERAVLEILDEFPGATTHDTAGGGPEVLKWRAKILAVALEISREVPEECALGNGFSTKERSEILAILQFRGLGSGGTGKGWQEVHLVNGSLIVGTRGNPTKIGPART